jgi:hypothetical protein
MKTVVPSTTISPRPSWSSESMIPVGMLSIRKITGDSTATAMTYRKTTTRKATRLQPAGFPHPMRKLSKVDDHGRAAEDNRRWLAWVAASLLSSPANDLKDCR